MTNSSTIERLRARRSELLDGSNSWPSSTYRLQFHAGFTFADARKLAPYLRELGISHVYASPYQRPRAGSAHGYDVANPNTLNPELGTEEDYRAFVGALKEAGLGQILDVVPNHMGVGDQGNLWWLDVLENGQSSVYAPFFDIDWDRLRDDPNSAGKVVLPLLGDQYGKVLEAGEITLEFVDGRFAVRYYEHQLPIAPQSWRRLLVRTRDLLVEKGHRGTPDMLELERAVEGLAALPPATSTAQEAEERAARYEEIKAEVNRLLSASGRVRNALSAAVEELRGTPGQPRTFDALDQVLGEQFYRLAYWRVAAEEINYRRFFDVNDLAAIRTEDPMVFGATNALLLVLLRLGDVSGVRIDHPDGLYNPAQHLRRLQKRCFIELNAARLGDIPDAERDEITEALSELFEEELSADARSSVVRPVFTVVEKILATREQLPDDWLVHGTTGYDFLNQVNRLLVESRGRASLSSIYARFTGQAARYTDVAHTARVQVMLLSFPGEIQTLAFHLKRLSSEDRRHRDFTLNNLAFAIRELMASLPVYRTYIDADLGVVPASDQEVVETATERAKQRHAQTDPTIFEYLRDVLLLRGLSEAAEETAARWRRFVSRFQQTSSALMAKGVEDTAFYRFNRLVSLNEVGGDPDSFGSSLTAFHRDIGLRYARWPHSFLATSTHDTKRSEDVRARIDVISEIPREWRAALTRWSRLNSRLKRGVNGKPAPDRNDEYLLYQTLLGSWPLEGAAVPTVEEYRGRICDFMLKAVKEAKLNSSWLNPNQDYESALVDFISGLVTVDESPFLRDFLELQRKVAFFGMLNSLSQTLIKVAGPGVADVYQGTELWDFSLVDPDNRRPVDYQVRRRLLKRLGSASPSLAAELLEGWPDGRVKLHVLQAGLQLRREQPRLFTSGSYRPLRATGTASRHVCAFARGFGEEEVIAAVPVLVAGLLRSSERLPTGEVWGEALLRGPLREGSRYVNLLTGECLTVSRTGSQTEMRLQDVFACFPVALLRKIA